MGLVLYLLFSLVYCRAIDGSAMSYWTLTDKDAHRNLVYVTCRESKPNLGRVYREVRRASYGYRPWRIIYKDFWGTDYELVMITHWHAPAGGWDRRSNPPIRLERWHGVAWDALKGN